MAPKVEATIVDPPNSHPDSLKELPKNAPAYAPIDTPNVAPKYPAVCSPILTNPFLTNYFVDICPL